MKILIVMTCFMMISGASWASNPLPSEETPKLPGSSIGEAVSSATYVENMIAVQQTLMDLQANQPLRDHAIRYNSAGYVEEVIFNDGKTLFFDYSLDGTDMISRMSVSFNGRNFLSLESDEYEESRSDAITDQANPLFIKRSDPETFRKFVACFKKPAIGDKVYYSATDPQDSFEPEQIFKSLKVLISNFEREQKKALEIYSRAMEKQKPAAEPAVSAELDGEARTPDPVFVDAAEIALIRSGEASREVFQSSIEKCVMRFSSRLEMIIPGRTVIAVNGDVTEILLVLPQSEPA